MRIGIVSETYPPEVNGVALTVHGLAAGLAARGHTVEVIRPRQPAPCVDEAGVLGVDMPGSLLPGYPGLRCGWPALARLRRRWSRLRPDAVYVATEGPLGWSAVRSATGLGVPVVTGFHTRFDTYAGHYGIGFLSSAIRRYLRRFHQRADATLVPTEALRRELSTAGIPRVRVLRRAVDTRQFHPRLRDAALRAHWQVDGYTPVALYVGRIAVEKNLALAVRAFRALQQQVPAARYVWVGDGPERAALQAAHPDFIFAGVQQGEALGRHYASADLFPFPSLSETFGNVILEALAAGVPVVACHGGAASEHMVNGSNGYLVDPGDEAAFIASTVTLGGNPSLIRHMGRAAHSSVAHLSPDAVVADFESLLAQLAWEVPHVPHLVVPA